MRSNLRTSTCSIGFSVALSAALCRHRCMKPRVWHGSAFNSFIISHHSRNASICKKTSSSSRYILTISKNLSKVHPTKRFLFHSAKNGNIINALRDIRDGNPPFTNELILHAIIYSETIQYDLAVDHSRTLRDRFGVHSSQRAL